jgi:hypothetical protein
MRELVRGVLSSMRLGQATVDKEGRGKIARHVATHCKADARGKSARGIALFVYPPVAELLVLGVLGATTWLKNLTERLREELGF